jgi:small subunit ribosomal protein S14
MARKSHIAKHEKREKIVAKFAEVRRELRKTMNNIHLSMEERLDARAKLNKLPRMSIETRLNSRCKVSGNPRAVLKKFGMSRMAFRKLASEGKIPGVIKASW